MRHAVCSTKGPFCAFCNVSFCFIAGYDELITHKKKGQCNKLQFVQELLILATKNLTIFRHNTTSGNNPLALSLWCYLKALARQVYLFSASWDNLKCFAEKIKTFFEEILKV